MNDIDWLLNLKKEALLFLKRLKGKKRPGFFHYSLSGDLYDENTHWGLGNTVFAVKSFYTLNLLNKLPKQDRKDMANLIKSFQKSDGTIFDPLVKQKAFWREKLSAIKHNDFNNFFHQQTIRAETRQAVSALKLLDEKPDIYPKQFPKSTEEIRTYLSVLNWTKPWAAGSHFSHLLFFLANSDLSNKNHLIDYAINWISSIQNPKTGAWYKNDPSLQQKINGAMKILTGLRAVNKMRFSYAEKLIDLALKTKNNKHACDNFNVIYVLKYANEATEYQYRNKEIKDFATKLLSSYRKFYWPEHGGFSFFEKRSNDHYYGATITKGLAEPDIHGTTLFLWGLSLLAQILEIKDQLGFQEFVA